MFKKDDIKKEILREYSGQAKKQENKGTKDVKDSLSTQVKGQKAEVGGREQAVGAEHVQPDQKVQELDQKIREQKTQNQDLENKLKRALADYQNLQMRVEKQRQGFIELAREEVIIDYLPVLANLERATKTISDAGLKLVIEQFHKVLEQQGLIVIGKVGESFDPYKHECIEVVKGEENKVVEVLEKGFKLGEKIIKAAKVKVGKK